MDQQQVEKYVEKVGVFFEHHGFPPVSGRILGYLMTSPTRGRTFYELQEFTKASKSTISTALNLGVEKGVIKYITVSGDRKRYFILDVEALIGLAKKRVEFFKQFGGLIGECLEVRDDKDAEFYKDLEKLNSFFDYLAEEYPKLIDTWMKRQS